MVIVIAYGKSRSFDVENSVVSCLRCFFGHDP